MKVFFSFALRGKRSKWEDKRPPERGKNNYAIDKMGISLDDIELGLSVIDGASEKMTKLKSGVVYELFFSTGV